VSTHAQPGGAPVGAAGCRKAARDVCSIKLVSARKVARFMVSYTAGSSTSTLCTEHAGDDVAA